MPAEVYINVAISGLLTGLVYGLMALGLSVIYGARIHLGTFFISHRRLASIRNLFFGDRWFVANSVGDDGAVRGVTGGV